MNRTHWLLIRGLYRNKNHWGDFPSALSKAFAGANIVCLDLPGVGDAATIDAPWSVPEIAQEARARWIKLRDRTSGPWHLLSISLGSMVGMSWCERYPNDFERIVLINSSASDLARRRDRFNLKHIPKIAKIFASLLRQDAQTRESLILKMTSTLDGSDLNNALLRNTQLAKDHPIPWKTSIRQLVAAARFRSPSRIAIPTLVIRSLNDQLVHPDISARIAEKFGAPLLEHPSAGHDLPLDDPGWLAHAVARWCERPDVSSTL